MKRGEIWWAELPPPVGNRPVVILTRDAVLDNIGGIVVALVTRTARQLPTEVALGRRQGLPVPCVANLDNILTVPLEAADGGLRRQQSRGAEPSHQGCPRCKVTAVPKLPARFSNLLGVAIFM